MGEGERIDIGRGECGEGGGGRVGDVENVGGVSRLRSLLF